MDCSRTIHAQVLKKVVIPPKIVAVFEPSENSCRSSEKSDHFSGKKNSSSCVFCSIIFGHDWSETLKLFSYRSEVGFEILIFMSHGDGKHKNVNLLLIAFI